MSDDLIKPSASALREALTLAEELLRNVELGQIPLTNAALKATRLARLLNDFTYAAIFEYESSGYPSTPQGVERSVFALGRIAGRVHEVEKDEKTVEQLYLESIQQLEGMEEAAKLGIQAARDPDVSIASANPHQWVSQGTGNILERNRLHSQLMRAQQRLSSRRALIHKYAASKYLELRFSGIAGDSFSRIRELVDSDVGTIVPTAVQKFAAIYENLSSDNPEDWSNAVHSCRRVLQDLADALFPASNTPYVSKGGKEVKVGPDNYINRLACFAENHAESERFREIVGSHLGYLGDRLDSLFAAAQKGSHAIITSREEADRYVVYTYMLVGDLLVLRKQSAVAGK